MSLKMKLKNCKEINNFKKYEISVIDKLKLKKNNSIINFLDKINPIIRDYMEKNSITVLLEKKKYIYC